VAPCRGQEAGHPQSLTRGLGGSDRVFKQSGQPWGLGGTWDSGLAHRGRLGINGLLLVVVIEDGKLGVSVDCSEPRSNLSRCPISSRHAAACSQTHVRTFATSGSTDWIGACSRCAGILRLRARPNKRASGITTGNWSWHFGAFVITFGRRSLAKASSVLLGPGMYWPHPTEGITRPAALPKPRVAQHSRHFQHRPCPPYAQSRDRDWAYTRTLHEVGDFPSRCPRAIALTYAQYACCKRRQYFNSAAAKLAPPHEPGHTSGPRSDCIPGGRGRFPVCSGPVVSVA
jgi:hypothetical protein